MKINLIELINGLKEIQYRMYDKDTPEVEISLREENIDTGVIMSSLIFSCTYNDSKSISYSWSNYESERKISNTLEIFPIHENKRPIFTIQESRELIPKKE